MTMHEFLTSIESLPEINEVNELTHFMSCSEPIFRISLSRASKKGFIQFVRIKKGVIKFRLTESGTNRLNWWNENGCSIEDCSCHRNK